MLWALVPVKEVTRSKQRLAEVIESREREGLVLAMLRDDVRVMGQSPLAVNDSHRRTDSAQPMAAPLQYCS